ncbi:polysaccharide biosynthesis C-terminal domain-containing protein [Actinomadura sp. 6N118]|uniref:oligosaccharide flippase family protein n=1 Tax=Actinomadura sp. 6N118 TaxID=3375151 RepID=UPI0037A99B2C
MTTAVGSPAQPGQPERHSRRDLRDFARGGAMGLISSIIAAASGFLLTVVVARTLGAAEAGVFFVVVALFTIAAEIAELGADTGLVRTAARLRALDRVADLRRVMVAAHVPVVIAGLACSVLAFVAAPWIADTFADPAHRDTAEQLVRIAAPFIGMMALVRVSLGGTRGLGSVAAYSLINNVVLPGARPLLVGLVFVLGMGAAGVMVAWTVPVAVSFAAATIVLWRMMRRVERAESAESASNESGSAAVREFWAFSGPRGFAAAVEIALVWANVPLVAVMVSSHDAGIYATANRFVSTGTLVLQAARIAVAPQVAAMLAREENDRAERLNSLATRWVVLASWPIYLALACFGPFLLALFGEDFTGGAAALIVLAGAMLLALGAGNVQTVLLMGGKSTWSLANKVAALTINLVLTLLLVPPFGIVGAASAWAVAMLVDTVAAAIQVRYLLGLRLDMRKITVTGLWALVWFGLAGVALRLAFGTSALVFGVYIVIACAGYGATLWCLRGSLEAGALLGAIKNRGQGGQEGQGEEKEKA